MKKLLILVVIVVFLISGCGIKSNEQVSEAGQATGNNISKEQNLMEEQLDIPSNTPLTCEVARIFDNEQSFITAIKDDSKQSSENQCNLEEIQYYFVPEVVPEGVTLDHIAVKDFYVAFLYLYDVEPDPYWERRFVFEWYRTKTTGDTEMNVRNQFSEEKIKQKNEYYIIKIEPWDDYKGDNEYVCQDVYWEKNGYAFHAVVPIWFTEEDIEKYCVAKKVNCK